MTFKRLLYSRFLRDWRRLACYSSIRPLPIKHLNRTALFGCLTFGVGSISAFLFLKKATCLSVNATEKPSVPRRLQRFLSFASIEYKGCVYMTPQDLLDSLIHDQPRERVFRNVLHTKDVDKFLRTTPPLKKADKSLFRRLGNDGLISYSEYIFLLTLLTKSQSSFRIAFSIFDEDGNKKIDKAEFLKIRAIINSGLDAVSEQNFEQLSMKKPTDSKDIDDMKAAVTLPANAKRPETTILVHLFGPHGRNALSFDQFQQFYTNLQEELVEIEFNEFARGKDEITVVDFARLIFRYTTIKDEDQNSYIERVYQRMEKYEQGITKQHFEQFSRFLNNLEDFTRAVKLYTNANIPVSQSEFIRAVKCSTSLILNEHLVKVLFMIFDKNNDGQLSYSEFLNIMNDRVNRGFKNQTTKISGVSLRAFKRCLVKEIA